MGSAGGRTGPARTFSQGVSHSHLQKRHLRSSLHTYEGQERDCERGRQGQLSEWEPDAGQMHACLVIAGVSMQLTGSAV